MQGPIYGNGPSKRLHYRNQILKSCRNCNEICIPAMQNFGEQSVREKEFCEKINSRENLSDRALVTTCFHSPGCHRGWYLDRMEIRALVRAYGTYFDRKALVCNIFKGALLLFPRLFLCGDDIGCP